MRTKGVTLVELLIGMVMLAVVLTALLGLTLGTLNYSTKAVSTAERLQELTATTAYIGDNFQRAAEVMTTLTLDGMACNLNPSGSQLPCIALVVPEARAALEIDTYMLLAYRLEPRSSLASDYKTVNAWADQNSLVLMEYRKELCGGSTGVACSGVPAVASAVTNLTPFVVADHLVKTNEMSGQSFLEYDGNRNLTLRLRVKDHLRGTTRFTPETTPYELLITRRN
jgi:type II secretory pathway component PulJ